MLGRVNNLQNLIQLYGGCTTRAYQWAWYPGWLAGIVGWSWLMCELLAVLIIHGHANTLRTGLFMWERVCVCDGWTAFACVCVCMSATGDYGKCVNTRDVALTHVVTPHRCSRTMCLPGVWSFALPRCSARRDRVMVAVPCGWLWLAAAGLSVRCPNSANVCVCNIFRVERITARCMSTN